MKYFKSILSFCFVLFAATQVSAQTVTPEELFKGMDVNNDGQLSLTEYSAFLAKELNNSDQTPSESTGHSIIADFKKYDENEDGKIVLEEFKKNFEK